MADSAAIKCIDGEIVEHKNSAKAEAESSLQLSTTKELLATGRVLQRVRDKCNWLLQNFDLRKEARAG